MDQDNNQQPQAEPMEGQEPQVMPGQQVPGQQPQPVPGAAPQEGGDQTEAPAEGDQPAA